VTCNHSSASFDVDPDTGDVWCFRCDPPRCVSTPAPSVIAAWATEEMARQLEGNRTCALCGAVAAVGYHTTCDHCGQPVCGVCAVQVADGHFCPTCPRELPF